MSGEKKLKQILDVVQVDVGGRGLARDPRANLVNACPEDFALACRSIAEHPEAVVGVVTGFWIPAAGCGETDGPLGAAYLARTLGQLGVRVRLFCERFCLAAMPAGCETTEVEPEGLTHLLALERVGPAHATGRCHTMRGIDVSDRMQDVEAWFGATLPAASASERSSHHRPVTIGIGDGGNEIGMGKIPPHVIANNVPNGDRIACRVATDFLIVAGVSNWGAYALASGVALLRNFTPPAEWYDVELERRILQDMVTNGPLVDGVTGERIAQVDGLPFDDYVRPLREIEKIVRH